MASIEFRVKVWAIFPLPWGLIMTQVLPPNALAWIANAQDMLEVPGMKVNLVRLNGDFASLHVFLRHPEFDTAIVNRDQDTVLHLACRNGYNLGGKTPDKLRALLSARNKQG